MINLTKCDSFCTECIKNYVGKHNLKKGDRFRIPCQGIPKDFIPSPVLEGVEGDPELLASIYDPVSWAKKFLDWHCLDPDGEVWKRKWHEGTAGKAGRYNEILAEQGRSPFNRPYQAQMLRCTSMNKVFRIGRQAGKTECLCISMLHRLCTTEKFKIIVVTPYQSQIDLIFARLVELIKSSSSLRNSIQRNVKAPVYTIELKNGAEVKGFTAGTKSGGNADSVRGQTGNMLVFDETDYLSTGDVDTALNIITNIPDATVWMSSTPTGRREQFYKTCYDPLFKEFHYSSHVNPNFTEDRDHMFRSRLTSDGYLHEIMAEFGEQEEGVYQAKFVEMAQADYEYNLMKPDPNWLYSIGVDWNDQKIGVTVAVVGYHPVENIFYLVDSKIVSKGDYTQLSACQAVANYNKLWNPFAIYLDRGWGATQYEVLQNFGRDALMAYGSQHPDAKLVNNLKAIDFGGKLETYDYHTKEPIKKSTKVFLVENSVRRFEQMTFKYPRSDEQLTAAFLGYIVKRISASGVPVYEQQNEAVGDHMLDAVNLALAAYVLEKTPMGKPRYMTGVAVAPSPMTKLIDSYRSQSGGKTRKLRPEIGERVGVVAPGTIDVTGLPAANTSDNAMIGRVGVWPGFLRDEPPPTPMRRFHNPLFRPGPPQRKRF